MTYGLRSAALLVALLLAGCGSDDQEPGGSGASGGSAGSSGSAGSGGSAGSAGSAPQDCHALEPITPPACGSGSYQWESLIAGPASAGFDADLAAKAERFDRVFAAIASFTTGVNTEATVPGIDERALIDSFATESSGWDFEAHAGRAVEDVVGGWRKVAGAYAGSGVAADAFRYATLRDQGASCESIKIARGLLERDLDALHLATAITGVEGVIARGFIRTDVAGDGQAQVTTPLFDPGGQPLPPEKDNGTWREDNSGGSFPGYIWEDSCSRDMLAGWAVGYAAAWEAIRADPAFGDDVKAQLQADAAAIVRSMMKVGDRGYDLEIWDADGRVTYHGYLNENGIERGYLPGARNGFHSILGLGIVAALAYVAEEPDIDSFIDEKLLAERGLHLIARDNMILVDLGVASNYSNYHMAFQGGFMAERYLCQDEARSVIGEAVANALYATPGKERQPIEQKQTYYDFVYTGAAAGESAFGPGAQALDESAVERGLETLREFSDAPYWLAARLNCDDAEVASGQCIATDGTALELLGLVGRGGELVSRQPVPMRIRPDSNYYWRSNPYEVNGDGDGTLLLPGVDFRLAYWMGRWMRR